MPEPILHEPSAVFMTLMAVMLVAPLLTKRVNLPGIVGLILGGMLVGAHGLNLLHTGPTLELFGAVGLIYLMFDAGLELDLDQFERMRNQSIVYAAISFLLPQLSGVLLGRLFNMSWLASVLLGATYASQTLIAYPILTKLGIVKNRAVSITVAATIFTDIAALLVLGAITGAAGGDFSLLLIGRLVGFAALLSAVILVGVPRVGRLFFRYVDEDTAEFQFVLVVLFLAAVGAEWIGMHTIVGAFLAGLAVNATLSEHSKVVGHVHFMGDSLFVPLFLLTVGMRLDPVAIVTDIRALLIGLAMTVAVYGTKLLAVWIAGRIYDFSTPEMMVSWGLSQAQAAATLAAILVGTEAGLFSQQVFNGAILTVLFTTLTSPILVKTFGDRLSPSLEEAQEEKPGFDRILVPIFGAEGPRHLLDLAALLAHAREGTLLALVMGEDEETVKERVESVKREGMGYPETATQLLQRIGPDPGDGILRVTGEENVSMIAMELDAGVENDDRALVDTVDTTMWEATVPVLASRMTMSAKAHERIVLVIASRTVGVRLSDDAVHTIETMAEALELPLVVLATEHYVEDLRERFEDISVDAEVIVVGGDVVDDIADRLQESDHVVLTSMGSEARFKADDEKVVAALRERYPGTLSVLHHP